MNRSHHGLPRLDPAFYSGQAWVHWAMCIHERRTGWLSPSHHQSVRELLLHTFHRYKLLSPVYVLMPDHVHLLWGGISDDSDQLKAVRFFRTQWGRLLKDEPGGRFHLQAQSYDHVLRDEERERGGFERVAEYILCNPERKGLSVEGGQYPYAGSMVPGYPELDPEDDGFWDIFWRIVQP
jgi:putative transposase